ncbi:MAG: M23 family metallopeptidase [Mucinivorans sp.]
MIVIDKSTILKTTLGTLIIVILVLGTIMLVKKCSHQGNNEAPSQQGLPPLEVASQLEAVVMAERSKIMYGLDATDYDVEMAELQSGQTFSKLLNGKYGVSIQTVNKLLDLGKGKFNPKDMRAGNQYAAFTTLSADSTICLEYLVYERNNTDFIIFSCHDSLYVHKEHKEVQVRERYSEQVIDGSLSATIDRGGLSPELTNKLAGIYESTIDFFALAKGDSFRVLYEEKYIDTTRIGIGNIYGVEFTHMGKKYMAIRFQQGSDWGYWDDKGQNLRKAFLRAPLSFKARVSSKFGMRVHPITRIRRPHNGVDYAAPQGTSVLAVANGIVSRRYWDMAGGGNTIWVRHAQGLESGYLHLRGYAKGISTGSRVVQGQVIAYVGTTGASTGPHLDFRIKQNGRYIDPLKIPSIPSDPINSRNKQSFNVMMGDVLSVMDEYKH